MTLRLRLPSTEPFADQLAHFAECCRSGPEPVSSGRDYRRTMQVVLATSESARSGQTVPIENVP